jgi:hypothetical protein
MMGVSLIGKAIVADCTGGLSCGDLSQSGGRLGGFVRDPRFLGASLTWEVGAALGTGSGWGLGSGSGMDAGAG